MHDVIAQMEITDEWHLDLDCADLRQYDMNMYQKLVHYPQVRLEYALCFMPFSLFLSLSLLFLCPHYFSSFSFFGFYKCAYLDDVMQETISLYDMALDELFAEITAVTSRVPPQVLLDCSMNSFLFSFFLGVCYP